MRIHRASSVGLSTVLFLLGCSKERPNEQPGSAPPAGSAESATKPPPFDKGPVKIALVQYSGAGDYFQLWTEGARKQADAVGFTMQHYDAKADDAKQAADMKTAIGSGVAGHHRGPRHLAHALPADQPGHRCRHRGRGVRRQGRRVRPQGGRDRAERRRPRHPGPHPDGQGHRRRRARRLRQPDGDRPAGAAGRGVEEVRRRPQVEPEVLGGQVQPRGGEGQRRARRLPRSRSTRR